MSDLRWLDGMLGLLYVSLNAEPIRELSWRVLLDFSNVTRASDSPEALIGMRETRKIEGLARLAFIHAAERRR